MAYERSGSKFWRQTVYNQSDIDLSDVELVNMRKLWFVFGVLLLLSSAVPVSAGPLSASAPAGQLVDTGEYSLISAVNALRASNGLAPYAVNAILMSVAQQHAQYMASNGVSHYGPGGSAPWQRGLAAGYPLAGDLSLGGLYSENITAGNNKSVQDAVSEWQGDAPHLNTMLSPSLREIGAGVALVGDYVYYVIDCASPTSSGQAQAYTPGPAASPGAGGATPDAGPLVVNTLIPSTPLPDGKVIHVVKQGETLWLIAISYGVKIVDLRRLNNLAESQSLFPGKKLLIGNAATSTALPPSATATTQPSPTATASRTLTPTATSTPPPVAPLSSNSSMLVLGAIVATALVLAAVFGRASRKD